MPGTFEGSINEEFFVKYFNLNKHLYIEFLSQFSKKIENLFFVRVTTKQFSNLSNQVVPTRADAYLIESKKENIENFLNKNKGLLTENLLKENKIIYSKIPKSGISIKRKNSNFQIIKLVPNSFFRLFNSFELGAGASLYINTLEIHKNEQVVKGWNSNFESMNRKFFSILKTNTNFLLDNENCNLIKKYSNAEISRMICQNKTLQEKIFNGNLIYEEPYAAWYFADSEKINVLDFIPFSVTTGSGRSKDNFTIVLKPKN